MAPLAFEEVRGPLRDYEEKSLYALFVVKATWGSNLTELLRAPSVFVAPMHRGHGCPCCAYA